MKPEIDKTYLGIFHLKKKFAKGEPTAIIVHHTCTKSPEATRRALASKGCSTHFEIDKDGHIYQYCGLSYIASHCGSANCHAIGIDLTHMQGAAFPQVQLDAAKALVTWLCGELHIPQVVHETLSGIYPHRAVGNTACPGNLDMDIFNADV